MGEYRVIEDTNSEIQKLLNTWRHTYHICIVSTCISTSGRLVIIIMRTKKENC